MDAKWKLACLAVMLSGFSFVSSPSEAKTIFRKSFSYFSISGKTPEDLDRELSKRGPLARSTGSRHPGATQIKFGGTVTYFEGGGRCAVREAKVTLSTKIILPRWSNRRRANAEMRLVWDTLAADIKRHEERHAEIARTHANMLEKTLVSLGTASSCSQMKDRVAIASAKAIEAHGADQRRFDRIEAINFESRIVRLLRHRMGKMD
jgi:predicted secreted Zn-dependent protease